MNVRPKTTAETPGMGPRPLRPARLKIGELLVEAGLITKSQVAEALRRQSSWGSRIGDIVLAAGWVKPQQFYQVLARHFDLEFVNLIENRADETLFNRDEYRSYAQDLYLPWRHKDGVLWIATADPGTPHLRERWGERTDVNFVVTSKFDLLWELQRVAGPVFTEQAVYDLANSDPERSASIVVTEEQKYAVFVLLLLTALSVYLAPLTFIVAANATLNLALFFGFLFRTYLCWVACADDVGVVISDRDVAGLRESGLPIYTVLVPMYKEPDTLPILAAALRKLNYPPSKLDIKLVLEENDFETIAAAKALALDATFEIVRVPQSEPKTKPKACNYALRLARGKYLTIYDAEDKPEPNQLKKAVAAFRKLGDRAACIQARLNYYNASENWLTRMFALEYTLWFDMFLPALDRLEVPIPLGGTSNHFDIDKLRAVGGWDPFNVTEDADLGLRFAAMGYHVGVINAITYEEANSHLGNWIRQRSRWIKGYIQTWLVNMRHPITLFHRVGVRGFCSLQLFIGGSIISALAYPFLLIPFLLWVFTGTHVFHEFFPPGVLLVSLLNLVLANSCLVYVSMLAVAKRRNYWLLPHVFTVPAYWALQSIAAYKGLFQLVACPFYWEKTIHGISKFTKSEIMLAESAPQ